MRIPRVPNLSDDTTTAFIDVIERIGQRKGSTVPSDAVKLEALGRLVKPPAESGIVRMVDRAKVIHIDSASAPGRRHLVVLYLQAMKATDAEMADFAYSGRLRPLRDEIIDAECSCPATTTCRHLLMALTIAARDEDLHLKA